jgi:hypothetical protein
MLFKVFVGNNMPKGGKVHGFDPATSVFLYVVIQVPLGIYGSHRVFIVKSISFPEVELMVTVTPEVV